MDDVKKKAEEMMSQAKRPEQPTQPTPKEIEEMKKHIEQFKTKLEAFKKEALKKFPFITSISLIPPEAAELFEEEGQKKDPANKAEKAMNLYITLPDEKEKEYSKVKMWAIKAVQDMKLKIWVHLALTKDIWELCYDGKNEMIEAIAASMPIHDKGILGALKVSNLHKIMCLKKFENYIVSYVIAGSITRSEATKTSDVDVYIIVDDTDVKKLSRMELREKLSNIIYGYAIDAGEMTGVTNKLSPQIYLLTDFWDGMREARPLFFTFVRDGVPLYDRGTFMPWKLLLRMGKITGTPEAIDRFMSSGDDMAKIVKRKLLDLAVGEIYWSVITPSQGALMIYGLAPTTPRETVATMKEVFLEKEKLLEKKYVDFLERVVELYKGYEHEKVKEVSGKEIDELLKGSEEYLIRIKKLVDEVGKKNNESSIIKLHDDIMGILKAILNESSEKGIVEKFKSELINRGKFPSTSMKILDEVLRVKKKPEKLSKTEFERTKRDAQQLISMLTEFTQRGKLSQLERTKFHINVEGKEGELHFVDKKIFLIKDSKQPEILRVDLEKGVAAKATSEELVEANKRPSKIMLTGSVLSKIEKIASCKIELVF